MSSLWGEAFEVKKPSTKKIIEKTSNPKKVEVVSSDKILKSKKVSIEDKLKLIRQEVYRVLGSYAKNTVVIKSYDEFKSYIDKAIKNGVIAVDTETNNSLDPISCKIMGLCLYTPGMKNAYIPVNHIDIKTKEKFSWQVTEEQIKEQLSGLDTTKIIMHNGKFDYEVLKCTCNIALHIDWDTMIGAKVLNELERAGLKQQYIEKIDSSIEKYSIEGLFEKIEYAVVEPELFALYAATDAFMTYKLYEYQLNEFNKPENQGLYNLFSTIEMPVVPVVAEMELAGVCIDNEYSERLSKKYHKLYDDVQLQIDRELKKYATQIANWRLTPEANYKEIKNGKPQKSKNEQLENPVKWSSTTQLAILLYDILKQPVVDKKTPRGTGEEILNQIDLPICKLILQSRGLLKLINTYIDKLPECVSPVDGRLHAHFNQFGADTGRFSSSDPNLQNIPSHNNEIRMMFIAAPGNVLVGGDFSQQEPRLLSHYSGDEHMVNAYKEGKDLYAMIASKVYHNNYEDNLEFNPITKKIQPDGKHRRTSVKSLLLGLMYGRGTKSIAEQLNCSFEEANDIKNGFFNEFPKVEQWMSNTQVEAKQRGYVEDIWGRRRRLPDLLREKYEVTYKNSVTTFNPLIGGTGKYNPNNEGIINTYKTKLNNAKYKSEIDNIKKEASQIGISIKDNSGFIAQAERQCVNARIQGGAASMSKRAMINVYNNEELRELGFKLLIAVHDELIGECPIENAERVKELLSQEMIDSALPEVKVPMKCDTDSFPAWYYDVYQAEIKKEFDTLNHDFNLLCNNHTECTPEQLSKILNI